MQLKIILESFSGRTVSVLYDDFSLEDQVNKNIINHVPICNFKTGTYIFGLYVEDRIFDVQFQ